MKKGLETKIMKKKFIKVQRWTSTQNDIHYMQIQKFIIEYIPRAMYTHSTIVYTLNHHQVHAIDISKWERGHELLMPFFNDRLSSYIKYLLNPENAFIFLFFFNCFLMPSQITYYIIISFVPESHSYEIYKKENFSNDGQNFHTFKVFRNWYNTQALIIKTQCFILVEFMQVIHV